jgi:hypothetical protein
MTPLNLILIVDKRNDGIIVYLPGIKFSWAFNSYNFPHSKKEAIQNGSK